MTDNQPEQQEQEQDDSLHAGGLRRLFTSSKYLVAGAAVIGVIVMNVLGKIDGPTALNAVLWIVGAAVGATAVEDGLEKLSGGRKPSTLEVMGRLTPVLDTLMQIFKTPSGAMRPPTEILRCDYTVKKGDVLENIALAAEVDPALVDLMNGSDRETYWKEGAKVALPVQMCIYLRERRKLS